ncbi:hypothetical protein NN3_51770 [Nocardia neocaledoniensis NBRC 108232]|uniref:DUF418 domain-containing protein n=1 Tax=Nocardia neocaledoniensis TaxID=236511 RepID=A0A317N3C0_9NOCA|nr:DUF418 domain-containing protein [Nocardia neocaledoniensis]PWV68767.1 uncharacterized protein DFR69_11786 [Nocardia neocaledoniensis]GEM34170.1 hypothetical protein NN3_51770 [Nocardia neocaledoniensis NBRC 108232]
MSESVQQLAPGTTERPGRLIALDVLRGIAILGTLGTNIWIFTDPAGLVGYIEHLGGAAENGWGWTERVLQQLAQGKFLGLLTVMFGIGLAIQQSSARRGGRRWPGKYPWRAGLLFLDGLLNFLLVAEFDVLMGYAVTGLVVAYLLATSERAQRRWLIVAASIHVTMLTLIAAALAFAPDGERAAAAPLDPNPYADGSFWDLVLFRLDNVLAFRLEAILVFPMSVALFLLGARLYHAGVFRPEGARIRQRLMVIGFAVAAPLDFAVGVFGGGGLVMLTRYGTAPFVALGILAAVAQFYLRRPRVGFAGARLGEVGRTALSCYILQNLIAGILCYGWGFGLAARTSEAARVPFTIGIYLLVVALITLFAHLWLRRFQRGPVEWLWHRTYQLVAE